MTRAPRIVCTAVLVLLGACEAPGPGIRGPMPALESQAVPPRGVEPAEAPPAPKAPELTQKAFVRECLKQDDCEAPRVCVARGPRDIRCEVFEGSAPPPRTGPGGRPVPPLRLLDGAAVRQSVGAAP